MSINKTDWKKTAGLILALGLPVMIITSIILFLVVTIFAPITKIFLILTGIVLIAAIVFNWKWIKKIFERSTSLTGIYKIIQFIVIIGLMMFLYFLASTVKSKINFSTDRLDSLSLETKDILKSLTNDLEIKLFKPSAVNPNPVIAYQEDLLQSYVNQSKRVKLTIIDPIKNPVVAQEYNIHEPGVVVFEYKSNRIHVKFDKIVDMDQRSGKVTYKGEIAYTGAIKNLIYSKTKNAYVLVGHNEIRFGDKESIYGFYGVFEELKKDFVKLTPLDLIKYANVPDDCGVLIIGNPMKSLTVEELSKINNYLNSGGSIMVLLEFKTHFLINDILRNMGLFYINNIIIEADPNYYSPDMGKAVFIPRILYSKEITLPIQKSKMNLILSTAGGLRQLKGKDRPSGYTYFIRPLLKTSDYSYGETSLAEIAKGLNAIKQDKNDIRGPLYPAYSSRRLKFDFFTNDDGTVETNKTESKMVVIGDTDFINNYNFYKSGNLDFFLNSINYLLQREERITVRAKSPKEKSALTLSGSQRGWMAVLALLLWAVYLAVGIVIVVRRRKIVRQVETKK